MRPSTSLPRVALGGRKELGSFTWTLLRVVSRRVGTPVPDMMLVLGRHRSMFLPWLWFASRLMPRGLLPAVDTEMLILRVASRCKSEYERAHHLAIGECEGLGAAIMAWTAEAPGTSTPAPAGEGIDPERAALLVRAADELIDTHDLSDETWAELAAIYDEKQLIELPMVVGHYAMLAGTLNAVRLRLEPDSGAVAHKLR